MARGGGGWCVAVCGLGVALAVVSSGCAAASSAPTPGTTSGPAPAPSGAPHGAAPARGFVLETPTATVDWPEVSARLVPLRDPAPGLVSADAAYASIAEAVRFAVEHEDPSGPPTAARYAYTNSSYGHIRPNGSIARSFTGTPAWVFTVPLRQYVDESIRPYGATSAADPVKRTGCFDYWIVTARDARPLTAGELCHETDPTTPDPSPSK